MTSPQLNLSSVMDEMQYLDESYLVPREDQILSFDNNTSRRNSVSSITSEEESQLPYSNISTRKSLECRYGDSDSDDQLRTDGQINMNSTALSSDHEDNKVIVPRKSSNFILQIDEGSNDDFCHYDSDHDSTGMFLK